MKKIEDLKAADFTGINEEHFEEWKAAQISVSKYSVPLIVIAMLLITLSALHIVTGFVIGGLFFILMIISLIFSIKANKLRKIVGINREDLRQALKG